MFSCYLESFLSVLNVDDKTPVGIFPPLSVMYIYNYFSSSSFMQEVIEPSR